MGFRIEAPVQRLAYRGSSTEAFIQRLVYRGFDEIIENHKKSHAIIGHHRTSKEIMWNPMQSLET